MSRVNVRKRFGFSTYLVGALSALLLLISALSTGPGGVAIMLGLIGMLTGIYALVTRRRSWAGLPRSRWIGAAVAVAGLVVMSLGSAAYGAMNPDADGRQAPAASASASFESVSKPEASTTTPTSPASSTVTRTPTPTLTPTVAPAVPSTAPVDPAPVPAPAKPAPAKPQPAAPAPVVPAVPAPQPAAPAPQPAAPVPQPAPPAPAPAPAPNVVHPGAFCSGQGSTGVTKTGLPMVCSTTADDDRARWRQA